MINNEAAQAKLADIERQVKELKEQLAEPGPWEPKPKESYLTVDILGEVSELRNDGTPYDQVKIANGNAYPVTPEGRAAAERAAFLIGFRARWRRSADVAPDKDGVLPALNPSGKLTTFCAEWNYGLPKWGTEDRLAAFVDSEGGPERFAEILARGIL